MNQPNQSKPVALITAGAQRLGKLMALGLAKRGYAIGLHYKSSALAAEQTLAEIKALGSEATLLQADLSDEAQVQSLVPRLSQALGRPEILINNASLFDRDEALTADKASWDAHMAVNLRAPLVLSQTVANAAVQAGQPANIINMLDTRVLNLTPHFTSYTVSKAGLATLTKTLASALASDQIRVNGIAPGFTLPSPRQSQEDFDAKAKKQPLGRAVEPTEILRALEFILDQPSMTGQILALDAGQHLNWRP